MMHHVPLKLIGDEAPRFSRDQVFFHNLSLDVDIIKETLLPVIDMICRRIEHTYKSPVKISYVGAHAFAKEKLLDCMQFDDIVLKCFHVKTSLDLFLIMNARCARALLIRLLATSLIDDSNAHPFSSTEKGIFSFITARLLFDLKNTMGEKIPDVKLIGIYQRHDETISPLTINGFGVHNFSFTFAADTYPITVVVPKDLFTTLPKIKTPMHFLARGGHVKRSLIFRLNSLSLSQAALASLRFGDLILFDHSELSLNHESLCGPIKAYWDRIALVGEMHSQDRGVMFSLSKKEFHDVEVYNMERLEIAYNNTRELDHDACEKSHDNISDLATNLRVTLSVEIARLPMTLKELCQLREGEIIDLHRKIDDPLELVVENKVIGYCQPVQIDGRLGIRVLKLSSESLNEA